MIVSVRKWQEGDDGAVRLGQGCDCATALNPLLGLGLSHRLPETNGLVKCLLIMF